MMLPEGSEVMQKLACGDVCPVTPGQVTSSTKPTNELHCNQESSAQRLLSNKVNVKHRKEESKPKQTRNRQKNRWKLKFHHQALPPEYLDHYEASLQKHKPTIPKIILEKTKKSPTPEKTAKTEPNFDLNGYTKQTLKLWAQKMNNTQTNQLPLNVTSPILAKTIANQSRKGDTDKRKKHNALQSIVPKVVTYNDLPYMGEMTLNNSKPRRGRKPKKADICHLIYENYGTIVPGRPNESDERIRKSEQTSGSNTKTDLQNKLITSLLERKMSQEKKKKREAESFTRDTYQPVSNHRNEEPLNLCIRDLNELKIQIEKTFSDFAIPAIKQEKLDGSDTPGSNSSPETSPTVLPNQPCLYWPNPQLYLQQLMYYQRLAADLSKSPGSEELSTTVSTPSLSIDSIESPPLGDVKSKVSVKQISELLDPQLIKSEKQLSMKRASPTGSGPTKRKRSAIFIPPVQAKNGSATPTTEVSICKFKFTGGSKPSLQEKKMLSVDSGGNFRYFSGGRPSKRDINSNNIADNLNEASGSGLQAQGQKTTDAKQHSALAKALARPVNIDYEARKKRKSRKSMQREKLEKTFKEKGFLIQTQQLESAEGATYCKFRQLRKFTRYLFRSWKDYLPGNLEQGNHPELPYPIPDNSNDEWS